MTSQRPSTANTTNVASTLDTTRFRRPNHNAAPTNPPIAAVVSGMATPCRSAWNIIALAGRSPAVTPVANCGANRTSVAAAVKLIAPSDPITKPSNDSRVGRTSRITTAGTCMRIAPPTGTPIPTSWASRLDVASANDTS